MVNSTYGNLRASDSCHILANIGSVNAGFIYRVLPRPDRMQRLNEIAIRKVQTHTAGGAMHRRDTQAGKDR